MKGAVYSLQAVYLLKPLVTDQKKENYRNSPKLVVISACLLVSLRHESVSEVRNELRETWPTVQYTANRADNSGCYTLL